MSMVFVSFLRFFLSVVLIGLNSAAIAAFGDENDPNSANTLPRASAHSRNKGKEQALGPSPVKQSKIDMSPCRRRLAIAGYDKAGNRRGISRKHLVKTLDDFLPSYRKISFEGEDVFLNLDLFDSEQTFLTKVEGKHVWISNRQRLELGHTPVCYRAFIPENERGRYTQRKIIKLQKKWKIQLHHLTMDMGGYGLLMIVPELHSGSGAAYYIDYSGRNPVILESQISKKDAATYPRSKTLQVKKNVLHPKLLKSNGSSRINRSRFRAWKNYFWKHLEMFLPEPANQNEPPVTTRTVRTAQRGLAFAELLGQEQEDLAEGGGVQDSAGAAEVVVRKRKRGTQGGAPKAKRLHY